MAVLAAITTPMLITESAASCIMVLNNRLEVSSPGCFKNVTNSLALFTLHITIIHT